MNTELRNRDASVDLAALNEALMVGLVRQHELREQAESLNAQLQAEIGARRKTEQALINSEKLASVGRMASVLSHEINNPLEAVTNILYLVQTAEGVSEEASRYLALADAELRRITHITRQTLGFYRESAAPTVFRIAPLLEAVCDLLQSKVISRRAIVKQECDRELELYAFQGEMRQVISNLVLNSLEAIPEGGTIVVRARRSQSLNSGDPKVRITVADNGHGIRREDMDKLFTPFFTTKGLVGNGLGLWVSCQIVQKHGGRFQVRACTAAGRHFRYCCRRGGQISCRAPDITEYLLSDIIDYLPARLRDP